jgi:uncharacterized Zn-finger protein
MVAVICVAYLMPFSLHSCFLSSFKDNKFKVNLNLFLQEYRKPTRGPHSCEYCGKVLSSSQALTVHKRLHTGERPYKCSICSKAFVQKVNLQVHMRTHSSRKPFACRDCDARFTQQNGLRIHIFKKHPFFKNSASLLWTWWTWSTQGSALLAPSFCICD